MNVETKGLKILIADDVPANLDVLRRVLESEGYNIYVAPNGKVLMDLAFRAQPDLILLDMIMPELNGLDACRILKQNPDTQDIPIIFVSANNDGSEIEHSFAAGGADFIHKPFNQSEILARVRNQLKITKLEKHNMQLSRQLEQSGSENPPTGLPDSKFVHEFIRWEAFRHQRHQVPFSIIMASVDQSAQFIREKGEENWQEVVVEIGAFLKENSRKLDCAGMWEGQDRFLILLPGTERKGAFVLAEKYLKQLKDHTFEVDGEKIKLSMSFGISEYHPKEREVDNSILFMIHQADTCLGRAQKKESKKIVLPAEF